MNISAKGKYALKILIDLANHNDGYVSLKLVAERLDCSFKYLEKIANLLVKSGYILALKGQQGGYKLAKDIDSYNIGDILRLTEKSLTPISCVSNPCTCVNSSSCKRHKVWIGLTNTINNYLDQFTLRDILEGDIDGYTIGN